MDKTNVNVGKPAIAGGIYRGPLTATLPTTASAALTGFNSVGYINEDGVTWNYGGDTEEYKAWGGDVVYTDTPEVEDTVQFTMIETVSAEAVKAFWGDGAYTEASGGYSLAVGEPDHTAHAWVIDQVLQGGGLRRIVIPSAYVSERGEIVYRDDELVGYDVTLKANADAGGKYHYEYVTRGTVGEG